MVSERSGIKGDFLKCYVEIRLGKKFERKFAWLGEKNGQTAEWNTLRVSFHRPWMPGRKSGLYSPESRKQVLYKKQPNENSDLIRLPLQRWEWWNCNGERPKAKWSLKFSFYFNHL